MEPRSFADAKSPHPRNRLKQSLLANVLIDVKSGKLKVGCQTSGRPAMGTQRKPLPRITFGPFEYDGSSGELRKHQTKLRLTGQPFRILEVLLEYPNQVG